MIIQIAEKRFHEQMNLNTTREKELSKELMKLESVINSVDMASCSETKLTFLSGAAGKKRNILKHPSLQPETLSETDSEICSMDSFLEFCLIKNSLYKKSDPLKCHTDRHSDKQ